MNDTFDGREVCLAKQHSLLHMYFVDNVAFQQVNYRSEVTHLSHKALFCIRIQNSPRECNDVLCAMRGEKMADPFTKVPQTSSDNVSHPAPEELA